MDGKGPLRIPALPPNAPGRGNALSRALGRWTLRLGGWRIDGELPDVLRCVIIVAPHTSNWDFVWGLATKLALGLQVDWIGKHTLFRFPFGFLLRRLGGIPVARHAPGDIVERIAQQVKERRQVFLGLSPEGTRRKVERWKTGFHRIAMVASVPIFPVALDYSARCVRLFPLYQATGDYQTDLHALQRHFHAGMALKPNGY